MSKYGTGPTLGRYDLPRWNTTDAVAEGMCGMLDDVDGFLGGFHVPLADGTVAWLSATMVEVLAHRVAVVRERELQAGGAHDA